MDNNNKILSVVFPVFILLGFYSFGGGIVNSLVGYPTWRWVGANEFPKFHQVDSALIIPLFVVPTFLTFVPLILLFWFRPRIISKWMVGLALLFKMIAVVSTITIQIPIQIELDTRFSEELIERLISTDMIFRKIPMILLAITNFIMLYKVVNHSNNNTKAST